MGAMAQPATRPTPRSTARSTGRPTTIDQDGQPAEAAADDDGFSLGGIRLSSIDPQGVIRKALTAAGLMKG